MDGSYNITGKHFSVRIERIIQSKTFNSFFLHVYSIKGKKELSRTKLSGTHITDKVAIDMARTMVAEKDKSLEAGIPIEGLEEVGK